MAWNTVSPRGSRLRRSLLEKPAVWCCNLNTQRQNCLLCIMRKWCALAMKLAHLPCMDLTKTGLHKSIARLALNFSKSKSMVVSTSMPRFSAVDPGEHLFLVAATESSAQISSESSES